MFFLPALLFVNAQHGDEAVGFEHVGASLAAAGRRDSDLLQQPVAFPQVRAGMGLCALGRVEARWRQAAGGLVWPICLLGSQCLHGPHTFGHAPAQGVVGKAGELFAGGGATQPRAGEHVGELALRVVGEVLRLTVAGFLGDKVAVPVPCKSFVFVHQQAVACPAAWRALWQVLALVTQHVEAGVGQAAAHGLGPLVFFALTVGAFVALLRLLASALGACGIEQVVRGVEGEALFAGVTMARAGDAAQGVVGVGAGAPALVGQALQLACPVIAVLALDDGAGRCCRGSDV